MIEAVIGFATTDNCLRLFNDGKLYARDRLMSLNVSVRATLTALALRNSLNSWCVLKAFG